MSDWKKRRAGELLFEWTGRGSSVCPSRERREWGLLVVVIWNGS